MTTLPLDAGLEQKELGLYATALNNADFVALARTIAKEYCAKHGSVTIDNVRCDLRMDGRQPSNPNAWGSIFMETGWRIIGYTPSQVRSNHHRRIARWEWKP